MDAPRFRRFGSFGASRYAKHAVLYRVRILLIAALTWLDDSQDRL
ncbi:hypothetical protein FHR32_000937 [Streptosporangium album]|uniref:Uncharacterized protein n=1 Tax=Streptosporangium album TaxID=47479 RepID=A0A7W7RR50_9ACTN|nr:hypothetical protein [Streptosporangium album]MBB4936632.1 hypothetical protein [Streptosporangium album]